MGLKIENAAEDRATMWLYGPIGGGLYEDGVTADQFRKELSSLPKNKPIDLHINSPGGSFFDAITMHSLLRQRSGEISVMIDGLAASGASIVAMAGTTVDMAEGSWIMIHRVHGLAMGTADDFRKAAADMEQMDGQLVGLYSKRWKGEEEDLIAAIDAETWFTGQEAVEMGLADSVDASVAMAASADLSLLNKLGVTHLPAEVVERFNATRRKASVEAGFTKLASDLAEVAAMTTKTIPEEENETCDVLST